MYDVIIIGAGAAGMTAALYTGRKQLKTLVISMDVGGQTSIPSNIENYPGFEGVKGSDLMMKFQTQTMKWGAEMITGKVNKVKKEKDNFVIELTNGDKYESRAVILAFGKTPRSLGIPGEEKFLGKGVSTCVTCDAPLYKGKEVAIIGGGNSALGGARELADIAKKIYLIHRRDEFRGDELEVERIKKLDNVELVLSHTPVEVKGSQFVEELVVENVKDQSRKELKVDGVFIEIGFRVESDFLKGFVELNARNEVITDKMGRTSQEGVFAAGDVTDIPFKQTIISAGEGSKAALGAHLYLRGEKTTGRTLDWSH